MPDEEASATNQAHTTRGDHRNQTDRISRD